MPRNSFSTASLPLPPSKHPLLPPIKHSFTHQLTRSSPSTSYEPPQSLRCFHRPTPPHLRALSYHTIALRSPSNTSALPGRPHPPPHHPHPHNIRTSTPTVDLTLAPSTIRRSLPNNIYQFSLLSPSPYHQPSPLPLLPPYGTTY